MNPTTPTARWQIFTAAPHRVLMFGGALQLLATLLFWSAELTGRYTGWWQLTTTLPPMWAHAFLMLYTLFPFFFFGFLMTTYPRWMNGPLIPRSGYIGAFLLLAGGSAIFYLGLFTNPALAAAGVLIHLCGLGWAIGHLGRVYRLAPARDKFYETLLNVALAFGWLGAFAYLLWLLSGAWLALELALKIGLWGFLLPVVTIVAHRMVPFFSSCVLSDYRLFGPRPALLAMVSLSLAHGLLELVQQPAWTWTTDLPLAALALLHTWRWELRRSFQVRLLAMLHVAFLWIGLAMLLYGLQSATLFLGGPPLLGRGPLHALAIGGIASMTVAMATRVTLGHSGRELAADDLSWGVFWGVGLIALLRLGGELDAPLNLAAAACWLLFLGLWVGRYAPIYLRPRSDGKPG